MQSDASGANGSLSIPTQFNGDLLATMESTYADGSAAGPTTWTSYQAFDSAFSPDYADGASVTLTFHFWSGATTTYRVTKSGSAVTGTTS